MPRMGGGVKFQHRHRMIAGTVSILTMVLVLWLWRSEPRRWVSRLGAFAVMAGLPPAGPWGITPLFFFPGGLSPTPAPLAPIFFFLTRVFALRLRCPCPLGHDGLADSA